VKLRHIAAITVSNVDKKSVEGEAAVRLCNYMDVYSNPRIKPDHDFPAATASAEQIRQFALRAGDVLLTKDSETPDDIGVPAYVTTDLPDVVCGYHLAILRPRPSVTDGRYLYWAVAAEPTRRQFDASAFGITRFGLRQEAIANATVPVPGLRTQRAIADFLDSETGRLDLVIHAKLQMVQLIEERREAAAVTQMSPDSVPPNWHVIELGRLGCEIQTGPFGSQLHFADYVENGWPIVNPGQLVGGAIDPDLSTSIDDDKRMALSRHVLRSGDIVVARRGEFGKAAVVEEAQAGWVCGTGCLRVRFIEPKPYAAYVGRYLQLPVARQAFEAASVGATMDNLNTTILSRLAIPIPPPDEAVRIIADLDAAKLRAARSVSAVTRQLGVLEERRQALITAAVTGQITIPGAA
jgi:type I restriction enzyme, S subunit